MMLFYGLILFVVIERIVELYIAANNEAWMKEKGAVEIGKEHYKYFVLLHIIFFISLIIEASMKEISFNAFLFLVFLIVQAGRIWCIYSLGRFWNTKIIVLPNVILIKKGPYKYIKHPNYIIVFIELFTLPAIFGAYLTAVIFPVLHLFLLSVRIPLEERALRRI